MKQDVVHLQGVEFKADRQACSKRRQAFWIVAYALSITIMGNNIPAPLYPAALGPSLASTLLHVQNRAIGGVVVFALLGTSALTQILCRTWPLRRNLVIGPIAMIAGLIVFVVAIPLATLIMFLLGIMLAGFGQGLTYLGSQELVSSIVTAQQRGEVFSVFNLVVYLGASVAALGVGFGTGLLGFYQATVTMVSVICILALIAGIVSAWTPLLTRQP
jgi:MFS family permease